MTEFLFVSLSIAQLDDREVYTKFFKNDPWSLSTRLLHYFTDRKSLGKEKKKKKKAPHTVISG